MRQSAEQKRVFDVVGLMSSLLAYRRAELDDILQAVQGNISKVKVQRTR